MLISRWTFTAAVLAAFGIATPSAGQGRLVTDSIRSAALVANVVGENPVRQVLVYLPPGYERRPLRRFPVLYLLHGVTSLPVEWLDGSYQGLNLRVAMDSLIAAGLPDFIVVMPDANNRLQASFYANSPATGHWEDFVVRDLVAYIDQRYRTDRRPTRRALAGHSMGGFGALALGFRHPDQFGLIYAMSPCCLSLVGTLDSASAMWAALEGAGRWQDVALKMPIAMGLAAALGGSATNPRLFDALPFAPDSSGRFVSNPAVKARWLARMPPDLASAMVASGGPLPAIYIESGSDESSLRMGIEVLRRRLDSLDVRYADTTFTGGHVDRVRQRISEHLLPTVGRWFAERK